LQRNLETRQQQLLLDWDKDPKKLDQECEANVVEILTKWKLLRNEIITKYADGYINLATDAQARDIGYPAIWLASTNYSKGPVTYDMITEE
jgi:hypothetical protein